MPFYYCNIDRNIHDQLFDVRHDECLDAWYHVVQEAFALGTRVKILEKLNSSVN